GAPTALPTGRRTESSDNKVRRSRLRRRLRRHSRDSDGSSSLGGACTSTRRASWAEVQASTWKRPRTIGEGGSTREITVSGGGGGGPRSGGNLGERERGARAGRGARGGAPRPQGGGGGRRVSPRRKRAAPGAPQAGGGAAARRCPAAMHVEQRPSRVKCERQ